MRAPRRVSVQLDAALVRDLRQVCGLAGAGGRAQAPANTLAVEVAIAAYVRLKKTFRAHLAGETS